MNAIPAAAQTATLLPVPTVNFPGAHTVTLRTAQTATSQPARAEPTCESRETFIDPMQRSSEEDVSSLYGGKEFDDHQDTDLEGKADNDSFLQALNEWLLPSEDYGPPISDQLAKIVNVKVSTEFGSNKRKEILEKYRIPKNCDSLLVPRVNLEIWVKLPSNSKRGDMTVFFARLHNHGNWQYLIYY